MCAGLRSPRLTWRAAALLHGQLPGTRFDWHCVEVKQPHGLELSRRESYKRKFLRRGNLTGADLSGAVVHGTNFAIAAHHGGSGITPAQLYTTASYQAHDLSGIVLAVSDPDNPGTYNLTGANFTGQNLTNASFNFATLTGANFANADIRGASFESCFYGTDVGGISPSQIYATASFLCTT